MVLMEMGLECWILSVLLLSMANECSETETAREMREDGEREEGLPQAIINNQWGFWIQTPHSASGTELR